MEVVRRAVARAGEAAVRSGVPASWVGYRWVCRETVRGHIAAHEPSATYDVVHPEATYEHPLPRNVDDRGELPADRGWWGFSFRDVPDRRSSETLLATLSDCRVVAYRDPDWDDDFYPAILTRDDHALEMREIRFRPGHAETLRRRAEPLRLEKATWIAERVYHNHSHWLTAHLPKLLLLRERGELEHVVLPHEVTPVIEASLRMLGMEPGQLPPRAAVDRPLEIGELTIVGTDRFRPELLRLVQEAFADPATTPSRRVFISRAGATRRRLVNEDEVWSVLAGAGFERVLMEELAFEDQVKLMRETAVLLAPHGAGLTNMLFCRPGTHVVEIADLSFPNPNFYALASGLRHPYWLLDGTGVGQGHPLERDIHVEASAVRRVLDQLGL